MKISQREISAERTYVDARYVHVHVVALRVPMTAGVYSSHRRNRACAFTLTDNHNGASNGLDLLHQSDASTKKQQAHIIEAATLLQL